MQKIQTIMSVDEVMACFARIQPVKPRHLALYEAIGQRVAEDVVVRRLVPASPVAARDGWALKAAETVGATRRRPQSIGCNPVAINIGLPLPDGTDAVVGPELILKRAQGIAAVQEVVAGDGVTGAADQVQSGSVLVKAGSKLTLAAAMSASLCGIIDVVIRRPVVDIILNSPGLQSPSTQSIRMVTTVIKSSGAEIGAISVTAGDAHELQRSILESSADVICTIGGTGAGPGDCTMNAISEIGEVLVHGVRLKPGGTFGFATVNGKHIFALPGGLADMVAANIVFSPAFARCVFGRSAFATPIQEARLAAQIPSPGKTSRLVLGTFEDGKFMPILNDSLSLVDIARAQAFTFLAEGSRHKRAGEMISYARLGSVM